MQRSRSLWGRHTAGMGLIWLGALACSGEMSSEDLDAYKAELNSSANLGHNTGLAVTIMKNGGTSCSGALVQHDNDAATTFAITASHCIAEESPIGTPNDPSDYGVRDSAGTTRTVTRIHRHPINTWNLGYLENVGKVDIALLEFSPSLTLQSNMHFGTSHDEDDIIQEGCGTTTGCSTMRWAEGTIAPHATYTSRVTTSLSSPSGAASVPGDSGGPLWQATQANGSWGLEAIHTSAGDAVDSSYFHGWAEDVVACGGFDIRYPNPDMCTSSCKCGVAEGDCDGGTCRAGLSCTATQGDLVGLPSHYDLCLPSRAYSKSSTSGHCASIGGCSIFEGDCNSHDECMDDLVCIENVGLAIGLTAATDVCDLPRVPECPDFNHTRDTASGRCTTACPCGIGDGDCDVNDHDTCRGILKCQSNVGSSYGFASASVDVCVHPDAYVP